MIAYGLVLLGIVVAFGAMWGKGHQSGYASAKADDKPVIEQLQTDKATAVTANKSLQADVDDVRGKAAVCTAKVATLSGIGDDVRKSLKSAEANMAKRDRDQRAILDRYLAGAKAPSTGTRQEQCDDATKVLGDLSDRMQQVLGPPVNAPSVAPPAVTAPTPKPPAIAQPAPAPAAGKPLPPAVRGIPGK